MPVALGRALIADPFLPYKAKHQREDEIRPCLALSDLPKRDVPLPQRLLYGQSNVGQGISPA